MKIRLAYTLALFALPVLANTPPEITNVRASQRTDTKLVDIYYDAADADGDLLKVRIEISDNDGVKYSVPAFSLTGDIGEGIAAGKDKHIVWDAGTDWDGEYSDKMRVKVFAIDAQGFPGLEWGNEVPPGGFLMGQDGGAEGSGESRHVCIQWSYWMSKYEITCKQYCDFLNQAMSDGFIARDGVLSVKASLSVPADLVCSPFSVLCKIGDGQNIRWNVNRFEPTDTNAENLPATVTWDGAIAFARYYGYDLPTEAEWEKAARGPENDDQDEHLKFPWGNEVTSAYANITPSKSLTNVGSFNGNQIPVGPDTVNGYGLYDVIGNVAEWTLTSVGMDSSFKDVSIAAYPQEELLTASVHNPYHGTMRAVRGYKENPIYFRKGALPTEQTFCYLNGSKTYSTSYYSAIVPNYKTTSDPVGFRVVRRGGASSVRATSICIESFNDWQPIPNNSGYQNPVYTNVTESGVWVVGNTGYGYPSLKVVDSGVDSTKCLVAENNNGKLYLPVPNESVSYIRFQTKGFAYYSVTVVSVDVNGNQTSVGWGNSTNDQTVKSHCFKVVPNSSQYYIEVTASSTSVYIDNISMLSLAQ